MSVGRIQITPQLVSAVRDAVDLMTLVSEHTELKKQGNRWLGLCPLHKEKTPSFSVDAGQGLYYCFGCGAGGDAIKFHQQMTGDDFPASIEALARRFGVPLPSADSRRSARGGREVGWEAALEAAAQFFSDQLRRARSAQDYLRERRIPGELGERYGLGYAPAGWQTLLDALRPRIPAEDLVAVGLVGRSQRHGGRLYDRFRHRLMFPIRTPTGRVVGFGGRTLGDDRAKYINTRETDHFQKRSLLFGLDVARKSIRDSGRVLLTEGYFDVLGAVASGVEGAVASMGTSLTREQARLLVRYGEEVILGYDDDAAGESAGRRALPILLGAGLGVRRARFGSGEDPDSLRLRSGPEAVRAAVESAEDAVALELERLVPPGSHDDPRHQAKAAGAARELLAAIPDPIVRHGYARIASDRLGIPAEIFWRGERAHRPQSAGLRPQSAGGAQDRRGDERREVRSTEERVLQLLLSPDVTLPAAEELPPAEAFFDPICRNIFEAFCALYDGEGRASLSARAVLSKLPSEGPAVDRVAQILLEGVSGSGSEELQECLAQLRRRFMRERSRDLARAIREAQRQGDARAVERLVSEKASLSRNLHRPTDPPGGARKDGSF